MPHLPSSIVNYIGRAVVFIIGIFILKILERIADGKAREWFPSFNRRKNGNGDGKANTNELMDKFMEALNHNTKSNDCVAEKLEHLGNFIESMVEDTKKRTNKAFDQHDTIIENIAELDVPRKKHTGFHTV